MKFPVIIEGDDATGYSAFTPTLDGVYATGRTEALVRERITTGIAFHIAQLQKSGAGLPDSAAHVIEVDVAV